MATEPSEDKVNLMTREIELTKLLASNDPKIRSDGIKQLKQLLLNNSGNTDNGMFHKVSIFLYKFILVFSDLIRCVNLY